MGVGATPQPGPGDVTPRSRAVVAVRRFLDWLVTPEVALDILVGAASIVVFGFLLDVSTAALWLGAFLSPLLVRAVREIARDWTRSRKLVGSALLVLVEGVRSGRLTDAASAVADWLRHIVVTQIAPAAAASAVTVAGFTVTEVALGRQPMFFGGEVSATIEVLGFTGDEWLRGDAIPSTLVASGGTLRGCELTKFTAFLRGEDGEEGIPWSRRWEGGGRVYLAIDRWPRREGFTNGWGPFLVDSNDQPTGNPLPGGRWSLTVLVDDEKTAEASVRLVNDVC